MNDGPVVKIVLDAKSQEVRRKLFLRVTFDRVSRQYATTAEKALTDGEFNNLSLKITKQAMSKAEKCKTEAESIIKDLGNNFSFEAFKIRYKETVFHKASKPESEPKNDISSLFDSYFVDHPNRSVSTRESYDTIKNWILAFKPNCSVADLTPKFVQDLEGYIKNRHMDAQKERATRNKTEVPFMELSVNTIGIYFRNLKSICNHAVKKGLLKENPLTDYDIQSTAREKRALSIEDFIALKDYQSTNTKRQFARDFFILSFLMAGMNAGDIFSLKNMNFNDRHLTFDRKKTGVRVEMDLTQDAIDIIQKYGRLNRDLPNNYVFPFYVDLDDDEKIRQRKHWLIRRINSGLEAICNDLKIEKITSYNARHTYATLSRDLGNLDASQIQKLLGHANITTTQAYLDSLSKPAQEKNQSFLEELMNGSKSKRRRKKTSK